MCSVSASQPTTSAPQYVHNPYLDGGAYGNSVDANRIGTSALTIGLDPQSSRASAAIGGPGAAIPYGGAPGGMSAGLGGPGASLLLSNPGANPRGSTGTPAPVNPTAGTPPPTSNTQPVSGSRM